jgi:tungstate transport system permease protein
VTGDAVVFHALGVSLACSLLALLLAAPFAAAYGAWLGLARPRGAGAHVFALRVGLSVPTVVIGLLVYALLTRRGLLGGLHLLHTQAAIVIGQTLLALPLLASLVHAAASGVDPVVGESARTLGAGRLRTALTCLNEVRPALVTAALATFGRCLTEVGIAVIVGGAIREETRTLPAQVQTELGRGSFGAALAAGLLLLLVSVPITLLGMRAERGGRP